MPASALRVLSRQTLALLDHSVFSPSELPSARQDQLARRFTALTQPRAAIPVTLQFRASPVLGANAMALPDGTIVVTDDLARLAASDDEVMAVLGHEAGHVQERHGLRSIIQSSVVSVFVTWYLGDINALVAAAPTALVDAKYSRDLERDADEYAASFLRVNGLPTSLLADILDKLEASHSGGTEGSGGAAYLSSHPATSERIDRLRSPR
jgi:Zn-dependent protease with chaperone function